MHEHMCTPQHNLDSDNDAPVMSDSVSGVLQSKKVFILFVKIILIWLKMQHLNLHYNVFKRSRKMLDYEQIVWKF